LKIDPDTAEVEWRYGQTFDLYGVDPDLPEEYQQIGREFFARCPGSSVWVWFALVVARPAPLLCVNQRSER